MPATRLAARRAEPLFWLAGVVRNTHFAFGEKTENRQTSSKNRSDGPARPRRATKTRSFRSRRRISVEINCLGAPPDAPGHSEKALVFHKGTFWDSLGAPEALPGRIGDAPDRAWKLLGRFGLPRDAPERDFGSILGGPESPGSRFCVPFSPLLTRSGCQRQPHRLACRRDLQRVIKTNRLAKKITISLSMSLHRMI